MTLKVAAVVIALAIAAPASSLMVNINAVTEGTIDPDAGSVPIFLTAGTYTATLVDGTNDGDPGTLYTAWRFAPIAGCCFITSYRITFDDDTFISGGFGGGTTNFATADEAFAQTPEKTLIFDVPTDQTVRFHLTDALNAGFDNIGGVTLGVVVPEPSTILLFGCGALGLLRVTRRRAQG